MYLNKITNVSNANAIPFKGDKNILDILSDYGTGNRDLFNNNDTYIKRDDIDENVFVDKLLAIPTSVDDVKKPLSKNFLITGDNASGKTTFMLRIAKLLKEKGIKTYVFEVRRKLGRTKADKLFDHICKDLDKIDENTPVVIFIDELFLHDKIFPLLESKFKHKLNIKFVCTQPLQFMELNKKIVRRFPKNNIIHLKKNNEKFLEMLNIALRVAGFEEVPQVIVNKIKAANNLSVDIRLIFKNLHRFLQKDEKRIDDINNIESISETAWNKILDDLYNLNDYINFK